MIGIDRYRSNATTLASPPQIVMMLLETALRRINSVEEKLVMEEGDIVADLHRVREILIELNGALDHEAAPQLCATLSPLYQWMLAEVSGVGADRSVERLRGVRAALLPIAEGWRGALEGGLRRAVGQ